MHWILLDKDIAITIVLFITILQNKQKVSCFVTGSGLIVDSPPAGVSRYDRLMKFETNRYYSKSNEIHLGLT